MEPVGKKPPVTGGFYGKNEELGVPFHLIVRHGVPAPEEEKQKDDGQSDANPGGNVNRQIQADLGLADKGRADNGQNMAGATVIQ